MKESNFVYFVFVLFMFSSVKADEYEINPQIGNIVLTAIDDNEIFPKNIEVKFTHGDNETHLILLKDDELTSMLSPEVADVAHFIPSGLITDDNQHEFYVYSPGLSDVIVVQRTSSTDPPKFYGRYTKGDDRNVIHTHEDDHTMVYLRPDHPIRESRRRRKRAVDLGDGVVELFIFADLSLFKFVRDNVLSWPTTAEVKNYLKNIMGYYVGEVDSIYNNYGTNQTTDQVNLRIEFMEYQIITDSSHQSWVEDTISSNVLSASTVSALRTYYEKLINNFDFPEPDHIMQLTRYQLTGDVNILTGGSTCSATRAVSIITVDYMVPNMAKAIGYGLNVTEDSSGCGNDLDYVMSSQVGPTDQPSNQGNRWRFSNCSAGELKTAVDSTTCLTEYDSLFSFDEITEYVGDVYTPEEQCQFRFGSSSYLCGVVDCYSDALLCYSTNDSACLAHSFGQNTTCNQDIAGEFKCSYGYCGLTGTTTSTTSSTTVTTTTVTTSSTSVTTSSASSTSSTTAQTTTDSGKGTTDVKPSTTTEPNCIVETGTVEFDLPGCGCCGGCGCDSSCTECDPGLPSNTATEDCTPAPDCCGSKVRVTTLFVPDGCSHNYIEGPKTVIIEKNGWENPETEVTAEVYQDRNDRWQVQLITDV